METNFPEAPKPLNRRLIGGTAAGAVALAVVVFAAANLSRPAAIAAPATAVATTEPTIAITSQGFVPASITVKTGDTVQWLNQTDTVRKVGSNPFPARTDLPSLYSATPIQPGGSYEYTFTKSGSWGYNDPTHPTSGGTVIVR